MRYWCRSSVNRSCSAVDVCAGVLATRMSPPVQRARSASVAASDAAPSVCDHREFAAGMIERVDDASSR